MHCILRYFHHDGIADIYRRDSNLKVATVSRSARGTPMLRITTSQTLNAEEVENIAVFMLSLKKGEQSIWTS